ncbi:2-oxoglutarate dehydrogenase, E2 component, dihydrolipoamide succinyltransferase [Rhodococcus sp. WS4]|nr:2-oxoglutarate dehydrogenase, E2 component, dihydrolipoamide succinyltransferase [Rhodococcus sp. WS4]
MTVSSTRPASAGRATAPPEPGTTVRLSRMRKVIASRMLESLRVSAQLTAVQEADVTRIADLRNRVKERFVAAEGVSLTYQPFIARAVIDTLKEFPQFNASIDAECTSVTYHAGVHLGVAVDTPRGLVVPVVRDADTMTVPVLARTIADLAERVRTNKISPDELTGSTFTISNIGSNGSLTDTPIINQPEVAILGTGAITRMPRILVDESGVEQIAVRSVCSLPLTYDHRLVDGADAGRLLTALRRRLAEVEFAGELASYESDPA